MEPDPIPADTSPDEPETGPTDDDVGEGSEDDATTAPVEPTTEED